MKLKTALRLALLAVSATLVVGCAGNDAEPTASSTEPADEQACGIVDCVVDETNDNYDVSQVVVDPEGGKADAADEVSALLRELTTDAVLDDADVRQLWDAAGDKKSVGERAVIAAAIAEGNDWEVTAEGRAEAYTLARTANIANDDEVALLAEGRSFAGTEIPERVLELVARARLAGAVAYDVTELDDDGEGKWSDYPSLSPAEGNMAFDYTMITPEVLAADMADTDVRYNRIIGRETATTTWGQEYERARYEEAVGGTGNIIAHYDEVYHPDLYARGSQGQKWANNVAFLSDGSIHCLPAARRDVNQRLILTNPALARGKHLLYNGHLTVINGVVVDIELSGRLSKMAARGKARFIDPIALLEAWGFELEPGLRVRYGNTSDGVPVQHDNVLMSADDLP